jgi:hypothetical protein
VQRHIWENLRTETKGDILDIHVHCGGKTYGCMYKGWAFSALAPRPTVVYCASDLWLLMLPLYGGLELDSRQVRQNLANCKG